MFFLLCSFRVDRNVLKKNELQKKSFSRISNSNFAEKRKIFFFEHATRAMNDNNFINLNQFLTLHFSLSKSRTTNKNFHHDDKLLNRKHIIVKKFENCLKKYMISFLHTFENKCSHCFVY